MIYAIFGIPLMLLYLTNIGGILAQSFRFVYGRFCFCSAAHQRRRRLLEQQRKTTNFALAAAAGIVTPQMLGRSRSARLQRQTSNYSGLVRSPSAPPPLLRPQSLMNPVTASNPTLFAYHPLSPQLLPDAWNPYFQHQLDTT